MIPASDPRATLEGHLVDSLRQGYADWKLWSQCMVAAGFAVKYTHPDIANAMLVTADCVRDMIVLPRPSMRRPRRVRVWVAQPAGVLNRRRVVLAARCERCARPALVEADLMHSLGRQRAVCEIADRFALSPEEGQAVAEQVVRIGRSWRTHARKGAA